MQFLVEYQPTTQIWYFLLSINPQELLTGTKVNYNKHIHTKFDEYVQVHEEQNNSMTTRTTGFTTTKQTGNVQGGHWFYSFTTGRMLDW